MTAYGREIRPLEGAEWDDFPNQEPAQQPGQAQIDLPILGCVVNQTLWRVQYGLVSGVMALLPENHSYTV